MQKKLNNKMCYLKLKPMPMDCWRWCRTQRRPLCAAWGVGAAQNLVGPGGTLGIGIRIDSSLFFYFSEISMFVLQICPTK